MGRARDLETVCRGLITRCATHWGVPDAARDVSVETIEKGSRSSWVVSVQRTNTMRGFDEAEDVDFVIETMRPTRDGLRVLAHKTFGAVRHHLRARTLMQAGEDADARPAWSLTMPRVQLAIIRALGIEPADHLPDVRSLRDALARTAWNSSFVMKDGDFSSLYMATSGEQTLAIEWDTRTRARIKGVDLPDTIVQSFAGRRLDDVVRIGMDGRTGPVIVLRSTISRSMGTAEIDVDIAPVRSTLARVPEGLDRTWLKVPWIPGTPIF